MPLAVQNNWMVMTEKATTTGRFCANLSMQQIAKIEINTLQTLSHLMKLVWKATQTNRNFSRVFWSRVSGHRGGHRLRGLHGPRPLGLVQGLVAQIMFGFGLGSGLNQMLAVKIYIGHFALYQAILLLQIRAILSCTHLTLMTLIKLIISIERCDTTCALWTDQWVAMGLHTHTDWESLVSTRERGGEDANEKLSWLQWPVLQNKLCYTWVTIANTDCCFS
jgi:hypothetical protein